MKSCVLYGLKPLNSDNSSLTFACMASLEYGETRWGVQVAYHAEGATESSPRAGIRHLRIDCINEDEVRQPSDRWGQQSINAFSVRLEWRLGCSVLQRQMDFTYPEAPEFNHSLKAWFTSRRAL